MYMMVRCVLYSGLGMSGEVENVDKSGAVAVERKMVGITFLNDAHHFLLRCP